MEEVGPYRKTKIIYYILVQLLSSTFPSLRPFLLYAIFVVQMWVIFSVLSSRFFLAWFFLYSPQFLRIIVVVGHSQGNGHFLYPNGKMRQQLVFRISNFEKSRNGEFGNILKSRSQLLQQPLLCITFSWMTCRVYDGLDMDDERNFSLLYKKKMNIHHPQEWHFRLGGVRSSPFLFELSDEIVDA